MIYVNNICKLPNIMEFKPGCYYKFVVMQRAKDGDVLFHNKEKKELIIRQWLIDSQEMLDKVIPDMVNLITCIGGRLYMCTDRKSIHKTLFRIQDIVNNCLRQSYNNNVSALSTKGLNKILPSASSTSESTDGNKMWLFDIDTKSLKVLQAIKDMCGKNFLDVFPTMSGYHVIAKRKFNAHEDLAALISRAISQKQDEFYGNMGKSVVELKDNAMVLVYADTTNQVYRDVIKKVKSEMW